MALPVNFAVAHAPVISIAQSDQDQPTVELPDKGSGLKDVVNQTGPIVIDWKFKVGHRKYKDIDGTLYETQEAKGEVNLTVNDDGSWNFSGTFPAKHLHDVDIVVGLKSSEGTLILFRHSGGIENGMTFNKQGTSQTIKDNFEAFRKHYTWYATWRTPLSSEGVAKRYEERKRHKEQLADEDRKKEEEKERRQAAREAMDAARYRQAQQGGGQNNGGGLVGGLVSNSISTLGKVTDTLINAPLQAAGDVANAAVSGVEDVGKAILSIF
jgi:hypothetical protein